MHSKVCLVLTGSTLQENLETFAFYQQKFRLVDMLELRVDYLNHNEIFQVYKFPSLVDVPVILTIRRESDGGEFRSGEYARLLAFFRCLNPDVFEAKCIAGKRFEDVKKVNDNTSLFSNSAGASLKNVRCSSEQCSSVHKGSLLKTFAYIDLEDDFCMPELEDICDILSIKIIRSHHSIDTPIHSYDAIIDGIRQQKHNIIKIASYATSLKDTQKLFEVSKKLQREAHVLISLGKYGLMSRILSTRLDSMWTYTFSHDMIEVKGWQDEVVEPKSLVRNTYAFHHISKTSHLFGIIGASVNNALSLATHNQFIKKKKLKCAYIPISARNIEEAIDMSCYLGIKGLSVTAPFKIQAMQYATEFEEGAKVVGACNTLLFGQGCSGKEIKAYNTDITGFEMSLREFLRDEIQPSLRVSVLGAGGAACAVCYVLYKLGLKNVIVFNRTYSKACKLASKYNFNCESLDSTAVEILHEYSDLIINTTSVGGLSSPNEDILPFYHFSGNEKVIDIAYRTSSKSYGDTSLVEKAKNHGCVAENGYPMFKYQAEVQIGLFYNSFL